MSGYQWDTAKNEWLLRHRGISFEQVVWHIAEGHLQGATIMLKTVIPSRKLTKQYLRKGGAHDGANEP